jgi:hypothetical protein
VTIFLVKLIEDAKDSFHLFCLDFDDAGDRTYPPPDPSPSLLHHARDNPPDRSTWSARKQGGYEAGERVDDEVRVGRRIWVRHGHVNVIRPTCTGTGLGARRLDQMKRRSGGMERAVHSLLGKRRKVKLRWEMGYIIISYSSNHITFFIIRDQLHARVFTR